MTFNVFEMQSVEIFDHASNVLSEGGVVLQPISEVPWSKRCATIIGKYAVCWWISI